MSLEPVPDQPTWSRLARIVLVGLGIVLAGVVVVGGASYLGRTVSDALGPKDVTEAPVDVEPGLDVTVEIGSGSTAQDIGAILAANGVVRTALEFEVAVRNVQAGQRLQAGTYELKTLMDPADVV
ncbi:MAG TPA: hypothetical protein VE569_13605, partial [Acidimicrobiia bacterium]|nr:hypothetical protein [Acidimicrobiia bacterium]